MCRIGAATTQCGLRCAFRATTLDELLKIRDFYRHAEGGNLFHKAQNVLNNMEIYCIVRILRYM